MDPRRDAAHSLAELLKSRRYPDPIVVSLPRGGVPIGTAIAHALGSTLDLWLAREVPVPFHKERVLGGIAERGTAILDEAERANLDEVMVREAVRREQELLAADVALFRGANGRTPGVRGSTVIVCDEAIDAPWRVMAAARDLAKRGAARVVVATPILTPDAAVLLQHDATDIACLTMALDADQVRGWRARLPIVTDADIALATEYASFQIAV